MANNNCKECGRELKKGEKCCCKQERIRETTRIDDLIDKMYRIADVIITSKEEE